MGHVVFRVVIPCLFSEQLSSICCSIHIHRIVAPFHQKQKLQYKILDILHALLQWRCFPGWNRGDVIFIFFFLVEKRSATLARRSQVHFGKQIVLWRGVSLFILIIKVLPPLFVDRIVSSLQFICVFVIFFVIWNENLIKKLKNYLFIHKENSRVKK